MARCAFSKEMVRPICEAEQTASKINTICLPAGLSQERVPAMPPLRSTTDFPKEF